MSKKKNNEPMQWKVIDLHLHTPASVDYQQPETTYLDLLHKAESRGLDIIAFTDHNTIAGYRRMQEEFSRLEFLEATKRLSADERVALSEYRRLFQKILVLPGIEFSATFGFHILGIFPPDKPVREIEHLLLSLQIPPDQLDRGSDTVGASSDVLTVYRTIASAGGLVIAAHANSSNGVAMRGFSFGGQTRIAFTQDSNLHALEVTDLEKKGKHTTSAFFNGTKPEYPRRMHCIQGSDAHRLTTDPQRKNNPGVGDRATEVLISQVSFDALMGLFLSNDFARTRPHRLKAEPAFDFIRAAREEGPNIVQSFHESITVRGGRLYEVIIDICAFANTNGGTLFLGFSADLSKPVVGIQSPQQAITTIEKEIGDRISPRIEFTIDTQDMGGKKILRVLVSKGEDPPYVVDDYKIYVRDEAETSLAVRDEIVRLVTQGRTSIPVSSSPASALASESTTTPLEIPVSTTEDFTPRTGVEVVSVEDREGKKYFTMRDLRNGNIVNNVTLKSARRLWHYALQRYSQISDEFLNSQIVWEGEFGLMSRDRLGKGDSYDLIQKTPSGYRYYFGVTDDGIRGPWRRLVGLEDE